MTTTLRKLLSTIAFLGALTISANAEIITVLVGTSPGSNPDVIARTAASQLSKIDPTNEYIVENVPGASGSLALRRLIKYAEDGKKAILYGFDDTFTQRSATARHIEPHEYEGKISLMPPAASTPMVLIVSKQSGIDSVSQLVTSLKGKPINFGSTAGSGIVANAYFMKSLGLEANVIKYRTVAEMVVGVQRQDVQFIITGYNPSYATNPNLKILSVFSDARVKDFSDIPTMKELGHNVTVEAFSFWITAKSFDKSKLSNDLKTVYNSEEMKKVFRNIGIQSNTYDTEKKVSDKVQEMIKSVDAILPAK